MEMTRTARTFMAAALLSMGIGCESMPGPPGSSTPARPIAQIRRLGLEVWEHRHPDARVDRAEPYMFVFRVAYNSTADAAGIHSGDTLDRVAGEIVHLATDVERILDGLKPGDPVPLVLNKGWVASESTNTVILLGKDPARLGVQLVDRGDRCILEDVVAQSPASGAGLEKGDALVQFHGVSVRKSADLIGEVARLSPGQKVGIDFERGGVAKHAEAVLAAMPAWVFRNPPGWEDARETGELYYSGTGTFGWTPGNDVWVKTVFVPAPEGATAKINYFSKPHLAGGLVDPERFGVGPLSPGCQPFDANSFTRPSRPFHTVTLGESKIYVQPDIIYLSMEWTAAQLPFSPTKPRRQYIVELHREPPAPGLIPFRSLLLGEQDWLLWTGSAWSWRNPKGIVFIENGRPWFPEWKVEGYGLVSIEFKERALTAAEVFRLSPFEGVTPAEMTRALVRWKNTEFDSVLREAKSADLREYTTQIEQAILDASAASEREKDLAQRKVEKGQPGAEQHAERSRTWRARIEVLKPILSAIKEEIANRGK